MEQFFFEHMRATYGVEWIELHVVHGFFSAIERYRKVQCRARASADTRPCPATPAPRQRKHWLSYPRF